MDPRNPMTWLATALLVLALSCGGNPEVDPSTLTPAPTATPTPTRTPTPTPTPTPLPALPSFNTPAPVDGPGVSATPEATAPLGKARNPSPRGEERKGTPVPMPEKCAHIPVDRLNPADILRCSNEALLEAPSYRFVTQVQAVASGQSEAGGALEVRGVYERRDSKLEYVAIYSTGGQLVERVDFRQVGDKTYSRMKLGASQSDWKVGVATGPPSATVGNVGLRSAVMLTAERGGMLPPSPPECGGELARLLPPDQSGGADYYVVEIFPESPHADGCGGYLVETHWVARASLRPWRVVVETQGDEQVRWSGQMVFSEYDEQFEIDPPPGVEGDE